MMDRRTLIDPFVALVGAAALIAAFTIAGPAYGDSPEYSDASVPVSFEAPLSPTSNEAEEVIYDHESNKTQMDEKNAGISGSTDAEPADDKTASSGQEDSEDVESDWFTPAADWFTLVFKNDNS